MRKTIYIPRASETSKLKDPISANFFKSSKNHYRCTGFYLYLYSGSLRIFQSSVLRKFCQWNKPEYIPFRQPSSRQMHYVKSIGQTPIKTPKFVFLITETPTGRIIQSNGSQTIKRAFLGKRKHSSRETRCQCRYCL